MLYGTVRDASPRVMFALPVQEEALEIEFVVDTGFEGELALPSQLAGRLSTHSRSNRLMFMADGTVRDCPLCYLDLFRNDEVRSTEILILEGNPLMGMLFMEGMQIHIEANEGGEVALEFM